MAVITINGTQITIPDFAPLHIDIGDQERFVNNFKQQQTLLDSMTEVYTQIAAAMSSVSGSVNFTGTSTTSLTVSTGSKTLTIETEKDFQVGQQVAIISTDNPTSEIIQGTITSYNRLNGQLVVDASLVTGSMTLASWNVSLRAIPSLSLSGGGLQVDYSADTNLTQTESVLELNPSAENLLATLSSSDTGIIKAIFNSSAFNVNLMLSGGGAVTIQPNNNVLVYRVGTDWFVIANETEIPSGLARILRDTEVFNSASTTNIYCDFLTDSKFAIFYNNGNAGTAIIGEISNNQVTFGITVPVTGTNIRVQDCVRLTDSSFMVAYRDLTANNAQIAAATVSGTVITFGAGVGVSSSFATSLKIARLSDTLAGITYNDANDSNRLKFGSVTISGNTVSFRNVINVTGNRAANEVSCAPIGANKFVAVYRDSSATTVRASTIEINITNFSLTQGSILNLTIGNSSNPSVTDLSNGRAVATFRDDSSTNGLACIISENSLTLTKTPTNVTLESSITDNPIDVSRVSNDEAFIVYRSGTQLYYNTLRVNGFDITPATRALLASSNTANYSAAFRDGLAIPCYQDSANSNYGTLQLIGS